MPALNIHHALLLGLVAFLSGCMPASDSGQRRYLELAGRTMGTTYSVKYGSPAPENHQEAIDSLLRQLNLEVSTYIPESTISAFNQSERGISLSYNPAGEGSYANPHFRFNLERAREIAEITEGYFEPTIMPLVNYWGFGYTEKRAVTQVDSARIDSLLPNVGVELIVQRGDSLLKSRSGVQLDFSAIAKGYGVDLIALFLEEKGIRHYFVEIGGEVRARGQSPRGDAWRIGISVPRAEALLGEFAATAPLEDRAIATSGNYRNYYEVEGEKYGHTINPFLGFPEKSNLLSASVFAPDCTTADAFATAFMVMGADKALAMAEQRPELEAYFIVGTEDGDLDTRYTSGLAAIFGK